MRVQWFRAVGDIYTDYFGELRVRVANSAGNGYGMKLPAGLMAPVTLSTDEGGQVPTHIP